jgi:hypothetical protein
MLVSMEYTLMELRGSVVVKELGPGVNSTSNRNEYHKQKNNVSGDK